MLKLAKNVYNANYFEYTTSDTRPFKNFDYTNRFVFHLGTDVQFLQFNVLLSILQPFHNMTSVWKINHLSEFSSGLVCTSSFFLIVDTDLIYPVQKALFERNIVITPVFKEQLEGLTVNADWHL
jgi:hypothetical protein